MHAEDRGRAVFGCPNAESAPRLSLLIPLRLDFPVKDGSRTLVLEWDPGQDSASVVDVPHLASQDGETTGGRARAHPERIVPLPPQLAVASAESAIPPLLRQVVPCHHRVRLLHALRRARSILILQA